MEKLARPLTIGAAFAALFLLYTTFRSGSPLRLHAPVQLTEAAPQAKFDADELDNIRVYKDVRPAVVNITSQIIQFDLLFGAVPAAGQGSGFVINKDGYILTNNHVIADATRLTVTVTPAKNASRQYPATVVGAIPELDLAVIRIPAHNLPQVTLGDSSNLEVGQKVLALGNPFGLPGTMTRGIISSIRTVRDPNSGIDIENAIQTDAAINPGNSGGPLLNSQGQVIAIDSAIYSETGSNVGIGFAIPINEAKAVINDLITTGHVRRPSLGVRSFPISPFIADQLNLPVDHGLMVVEVVPGSAAAAAGLRGGTEPGYIGNTRVRFGGDIIVAIDGEPIADPSDLARVMILKRAGDVVTVTIYRGNRKMDVKVKLGQESTSA
jgi:S1-C subfamily serine protease